MKKTLIFITALFLAACSSKPVNLVQAEKPILNLTAPTAEKVAVSLHSQSAEITNKTENPLTLQYFIFWYDKLGVTQLQEDKETLEAKLFLQPKTTQQISLIKPTEESVNYRFYGQLTDK